MSQFPQIDSPPQATAEDIVNENFDMIGAFAVYARDPDTTALLVWGYRGGRWGGFSVTAGPITLGASTTTYIVAARVDGSVSSSTSTTNWNDGTNYARIYKVVTGTTGVTGTPEDHRAGPGGVHGGAGGAGSVAKIMQIAASDESTTLSTGLKVTVRAPYAITLTAVRASLTTAQASGSIFTIDIKKNGTSILSTLLTIDNTERTSVTAATAVVISTTAIADDDEITIHVTQVGSSTTAVGLKVSLIGS